MGLVSLFFGFKGRINRAQFWIGNLAAGFVGIMLLFMLGAMLIPTGEIPQTPAGYLHAMSVIGLVLFPPLLFIGWISFALQTKRFHDRGRSGLWTMLPLLPGFMITSTIAASIAGGQSPDQAVSSIGFWFLIMQAINIFMFVDLGCMPGKAEANKYGPPPSGGFSGGAPSGVTGPIPGQSAPSKTSAPIPGMGMTSAESAIDRAIAAREKQAQAPAARAPSRLAPAPQAAGAPMRAASSGSFGRKASS